MNDSSTNPTPPDLRRRKFSWLVFFAQIFIPTIATIIAVQIKQPEAGTFIAFFGGIGSGLTSGIMLGLKIGSTTAMRTVLSLLLSIVFSVACVGMNCVGCLASGYTLNF